MTQASHQQNNSEDVDPSILWKFYAGFAVVAILGVLVGTAFFFAR